MTQVLSFEDYRPSPRFDGKTWTQVQIEEGDTLTGPWAVIDTITISPVDADPTNPAVRSFTTENASDDDGLWYRLVFLDADGDALQPTFPVQNSAGRPPYATVEELATLLRVKVGDRRAALQRVLEAAALEIDAELGRTEPFDSPPALVAEVNLERAVEHWQQSQSPFAVLGLGGEQPITVARDTWDRHAHKLAPLKTSWGLA